MTGDPEMGWVAERVKATWHLNRNRTGLKAYYSVGVTNTQGSTASPSIYLLAVVALMDVCESVACGSLMQPPSGPGSTMTLFYLAGKFQIPSSWCGQNRSS